ncbi:MAG: peptidylprolyl isomerase [Ignavibacteria bacterium]
MKRFFINLSLLFLFNSVSFSQNFNEDFETIMKLEDSRSFGSKEELFNLLYSANPDTRLRALNAISNIGDSLSIPKLDFLFAGPYKDYPNSADLKTLAFALGQIPGRKSSDDLEFMLNNINFEVKDHTQIKSAVFNSIGKTGDEKALQRIIDETGSDQELMSGAALSIGRFALRKIKNVNSVKALKFFVNNTKDTIALRNSAYGFWRIGDKNLLENARQEIYTLTLSEDPQTRMWAFNAIGKLQDKLFLINTIESFGSEKDWRVQVNMLNSLTNYKLDSIPDLTIQLLSMLGDAAANENEHISITAINVLGQIFEGLNNSGNSIARSQAGKLKEEIIFGLNSFDNISWRVRSELANSLALIYGDEVKEDLFRAFRNTTDYNLKAGIVKAFGNFDNGMVYREVRDEISKDVQNYNLKNPNTSGALIGSNDLAILYRGFIEMLTGLDEKVDAENQNTIRLMYTEFVGSKDPVIVSTSLEALKDSLYLKYIGETYSVINFDYNELDYYKDHDVMMAFIDAMSEFKIQDSKVMLEKNLSSDNFDLASTSAKALEKITGKKYEFAALPRTDFDWEYLEGLSQKNYVIVKTNKGDIKIELLPEVAPFTIMNFLKLIENNYYDGTIFHRVVPNFVIQGGDPTGTGYGSPGYSIRSEFSDLPFERGMVGMASSGKDTEGSQFFITHSATPHLDGKYTIFGRVTEGMDVVDKVMIGDVIQDIIVSKR